MKNILILVLMILAVYGSNIPKIVGGSPATTSKYPYQVALVTDNGDGEKIFCGGSIISKNYILTAAHCFRNLYINYERALSNVYAASTTYLDRITPKKKYKVLEKFIHPSYNYDEDESDRVDICLLRVSTIPFDSTTLPVIIARAQDNSLFPPGTRSFVSGFGFTNGDTQAIRTPSNQLQAVDVPTIPLSNCTQILNNNNEFVNFPIICAGTDEKDSCNGDSGGALTVVLNENIYVQIGIVIFGTMKTSSRIQCAAAGEYGVYTDVSAYRSTFIEPITGSLPVLGDTGVATNNGTANSVSKSISFCFPLFLFALFFFFF